jgi:hypothetical protein
MKIMQMATAAAIMGGIAVAAAAPVEAQQGERTVSVMVGGFTYDYANDGTTPAVAVHLGRRVLSNLELTGGIAYARPALTLMDHSGPDPIAREGRGSLATATAGMNMVLPLGPVEPYAGVAVGLFGRFEEDGGDRFVRTTTAFPIGMRAPLSDRLGARGEVRFRFDEHPGGDSAVNSEMMLGLTWRI